MVAEEYQNRDLEAAADHQRRHRMQPRSV